MWCQQIPWRASIIWCSSCWVYDREVSTDKQSQRVRSLHSDTQFATLHSWLIAQTVVCPLVPLQDCAMFSRWIVQINNVTRLIEHTVDLSGCSRNCTIITVHKATQIEETNSELQPRLWLTTTAIRWSIKNLAVNLSINLANVNRFR